MSVDPRRPTSEPLVGPVVRLDPTTHDDAPALFNALNHDGVWAGAYHGGKRPRHADEVAQWVDEASEAHRVMYTVRLAAPLWASEHRTGGDGPTAGSVVGTTSIGDIVVAHAQVHIGWTAYTPAVWGSAVNPACKFLLLRHAFVDCGMERVRIQTDSINLRSQAAIAKLGATREGVLRHQQRRADGSWRDTVVFSILSAEWPEVEARLIARLAG